MRTVVTGGAGFIGSNLVDALLARGHEVTVIDDFSSGTEANIAGARAAGASVAKLDICDAAALAEAVAAAAPAGIFHLAAHRDVRKSVANPGRDARVNVGGTINVLEAARECGARVINVSTGGAIYGATDVVPTPEHVAPEPGAPYGLSKFCGEQYVRLYGRLFGVGGATARLGNVYGPRQDPLGETGVVAIFCGVAIRGGSPTVFGNGLQTRDYVHVDDVVAALLRLLEQPDARGEFNIGTGREATVLDLIALLAPHAADGFEPVFKPPRRGEIDRSCLAVARAEQELGFTAGVDLASGLQRTLEWTRGALRAD